MASNGRLARLRKAILREWRGGDEPEQLDARVHQPEEFLAEILRHAGASDGIEVEKLREIWRETAGDFVARNAEPHSLKNGCLTLRVLQPTMKFHLEQMKSQLLANLREVAGPDTIRSIRLSLG